MNARTMLDIFDPPEGMVGHSAVLVAMTGEDGFLEDAALRFTGLRRQQRSELGHTLVYLMLDGHSSPSRQQVFPPGRIPGLHEFQPRSVDPGSLLHAKLALLAFAPSRTGDPISLRLAVLTANFTDASARHQLELAWLVDVPLGRTAPPEDRADIVAAGAFIQELLSKRFYREEMSLARKKRKLTARLDALLAVAASLSTNRRPRFIHSLERPLYDQIWERFRNAKDEPKKNLLLCGSGFYEQPSGEAAGKPEVFGKLEGLGVFTSRPRRIALVEPDKAGAVAAWAKSDETEGWEVVRPLDALDRVRRLHAKFVYAGYLRDGFASNGRLYVGSGNLSRRGLFSHGGMTRGNIETGVVIEVVERLDPEKLERTLFWSQGSQKVDEDAWLVGAEGDAIDSEPILEASPILSAIIESKLTRTLRLLWREDAAAAFVSVRWTGREWFEVQRVDAVPLQTDEYPAALHVLADSGRKWLVPVVDEAGRVGWQPPRYDSFADALAALLDFPIRPAEAVDAPDLDENGTVIQYAASAGKAIEQKPGYALHAAAEFIEKVAELQVTLPESMLDDWLDHLDRIFRSSFPEAIIAGWRTYGLDVFSHLRKPQFRSPHLNDTQRKKYFAILDKVSREWGLQQ